MSPGPDWLGLAGALPAYARIAWWGLASPLAEKEPLVVVQAVVQSDEGLLLTVRSDLRGWELPGGQVEESEDPEEALIREAREETGLEIEITRLAGASQFEMEAIYVVVLCTEARILGGELQLSDEHDDFAWVPWSEFGNWDLTDNVRSFVLDYIKQKKTDH